MRGWVLVVVLAAASLGCGGESSDNGSGGSGSGGVAGGGGTTATGGSSTGGSSTGGSSGAGGSSGSDAGAPIWPADAEKLYAKGGGGFMPQPPAGSECALNDREYTLVVATRELSWVTCAAGANPTIPYTKQVGNRVITQSELALVDTAMHTLVVVTPSSCGADKESLSLTVTTPAGSVLYQDSFYGCNAKPGEVYVDHIDGVFSALGQLAQ